MPSGTLSWWDAATGNGGVQHAGHEYPVLLEDIEPGARQPKARVRFDVERKGAVERAVNVRLLKGTRVRRSQHDFGDRAGHRDPRSPINRPLTHRHPDVAPGTLHSPMDVGRKWVELIELGDVDAVLQLYHPSARFHSTGTTATGRDAIQHRLTGSGWLGRRFVSVNVRGLDDGIDLRWVDAGGTAGTRIRIQDGRIVEQWR